MKKLRPIVLFTITFIFLSFLARAETIPNDCEESYFSPPQWYGTTYYYEGSSKNDFIEIKKSKNRILVKHNEEAICAIRPVRNQTTTLIIQTAYGDDTVVFDEEVSSLIQLEVIGFFGNDWIGPRHYYNLSLQPFHLPLHLTSLPCTNANYFFAYLDGDAGNDTIIGGCGDDRLSGSGGKDTIIATDNGSDYLNVWNGQHDVYVSSGDRVSCGSSTDDNVYYPTASVPTTSGQCNLQPY